MSITYFQSHAPALSWLGAFSALYTNVTGPASFESGLWYGFYLVSDMGSTWDSVLLSPFAPISFLLTLCLQFNPSFAPKAEFPMHSLNAES